MGNKNIPWTNEFENASIPFYRFTTHLNLSKTLRRPTVRKSIYFFE